MNNSFEEIRKQIEISQNIVVAGHTNPDGDAIGACLGLAMSLKGMGKNVTVLLESYSEKYDIIPGKELVKFHDFQEIKVDLFISLDCGDKERLGEAQKAFDNANCQINIDHHKSNTNFAKLNYAEETASSTSEIVFWLLDSFMPINQKIAEALYAGIIYDTAGFRHSSTSAKTMLAASKLIAYDINFTKIYNRFFDLKTFSELKIIGRAFDNARLVFDGKLIITTITSSEIEACNGSNKEVDSIVNLIKGVKGTLIACFLYEKSKKEIKVSFRCEDGFDVCALSQKFGGGGHVKAAGCTINDCIENAEKLVLNEVEQLFCK